MKKGWLKFFFYILILFILFYNPVSARIMAVTTATFHNLNISLFYKQIAAESSFRSFALSKKGAIGLGQVLPGTAKYIQPKYPAFFLWFPPSNLHTSAKYMKYLLKKYGKNWSLSLAAYNWGETNVDKRIRKLKIERDKNYREIFSDIPETYSFIGKILEK